jgi:ubiquinone/menaquinone biosynthesis C-methylase UbiE
MVRDISQEQRLTRYWDRYAPSYDRQLAWVERRFLAASRPWLVGHASGDVLEVAVGTGLNLEHYPGQVRLTGIERSAGMLEQTRSRAAEIGRSILLHRADAHALPFADASFDTVVCTFALCGISDPAEAVREMTRVLRPHGALLLADHVPSTVAPIRWVQALMDQYSVPRFGEHWRRRSLPHVQRNGLRVQTRERFFHGVIERIVAHKPEA